MGIDAKDLRPSNEGKPACSPPLANQRRMPPLRSLAAFEAAACHGSFAKGAEKLSVTTSAISHQIQQLEDFLGVRLFERRSGRVFLTAAGHTYAAEIERAFGIIIAATELVAPQSQRGYLAVACGPSFAAKWLQPRLPSFVRAHPEARIRLSTLSDKTDLSDSRFDLAIVYGLPPPGCRHVEPFLVELLRPLCSPALAASLELRTPRDLVRATLIHSINALTWTDYLRRVDLAGLRPRHEMWLDRSVMAIDAAVAGLGVVLESETLASDELRDGRLVAPFADRAYEVEATSYHLVRTGANVAGGLVAAFTAWLHAEIVSGDRRHLPRAL